jgi:hypothetical protein
MTKTELFALQGAANVLRDVSAKHDLTHGRTSLEFNIASINALDALEKIEKIVNEFPKNFLDHQFWNDELGRDVKNRDYEIGKAYVATWERDDVNGEYNLEVYTKEEYENVGSLGLSTGVYTNYLTTADLGEDIDTLTQLGYSIEILPSYLPLKD